VAEPGRTEDRGREISFVLEYGVSKIGARFKDGSVKPRVSAELSAPEMCGCSEYYAVEQGRAIR